MPRGGGTWQHKWRPMMEREMITMIVDTLLVFYYEKMVGYMPSGFADLVFVGERIEVGYSKERSKRACSSNEEGNAKDENVSWCLILELMIRSPVELKALPTPAYVVL